jgi:hypothetical protein
MRVIDSDRFRGVAAASMGTGGNDGGAMEDILKRLSALESSIAGIRVDVSAITATLSATLPHLATKAEVKALEAKISSVETSIIKWIIATVITSSGLAFAIAKFVG